MVGHNIDCFMQLDDEQTNLFRFCIYCVMYPFIQEREALFPLIHLMMPPPLLLHRIHCVRLILYVFSEAMRY